MTEINKYGLAQYHLDKLCYPYTDVPAFKFWDRPEIGPLPWALCPMRTWQDGRCGLCGFRDDLVEDHCHDTGLTRGMLCRSCNTTEGVGDGHNLQQWQQGVTVAADLGIREKYVNAFGQTPMRPAPLTDYELDTLAEMMATTDDAFEERLEARNRFADEYNARPASERM